MITTLITLIQYNNSNNNNSNNKNKDNYHYYFTVIVIVIVVVMIATTIITVIIREEEHIKKLQIEIDQENRLAESLIQGMVRTLIVLTYFVTFHLNIIINQNYHIYKIN